MDFECRFLERKVWRIIFDVSLYLDSAHIFGIHGNAKESNLTGSVIDKMCHENDTFQCIKPYDTPNGRSLRVVCHHCDLECVLSTWSPWQLISSKILPKI